MGHLTRGEKAEYMGTDALVSRCWQKYVEFHCLCFINSSLAELEDKEEVLEGSEGGV